MAYTPYSPNTWADRIGTGLNKFKDQNDNVYEFTPTPDSITQIGTPFAANWMNHIEDGINDISTEISRIQLVTPQTTSNNYFSVTNIQYTIVGKFVFWDLSVSCTTATSTWQTITTGFPRMKSVLISAPSTTAGAAPLSVQIYTSAGIPQETRFQLRSGQSGASYNFQVITYVVE